MRAHGDASTRGKAPLPPPLWFLLCLYNLWLEAVQHSILSSVAVAAVQRGSRNNCVPCRGCLNCWNKLLSPPTSHPQYTCMCTRPSPPAQTIPCGCLSVRDPEEHVIYLGNNHFTRHHTYRQCRVESPGSSQASWAAPVFSFAPALNWYCSVPQCAIGCIKAGTASNDCINRIGSRDLSQ